MSDFFSNIPKITQFIGVIDEQNFSPAPADWVIVITDIRSSTKAVAEGRYKDVNMMGGAAICAIQNATGSRDWPFVFGGDGATILISPAVQPVVEAALIRTRSLAQDDFGLELRIGFVPVKVVRELGSDVLVARYETSPGNCLAMFGGGGVELADSLIKSNETSANYVVKKCTLPGPPDLTGLSCRWEPLRAQRGKIVCLLIKPQASTFQGRQTILSDFLERLSDGMGTELSQASPVNTKSLRFRWPPKGLFAEAKATRAGKTLIRRLMEVYISSFNQWILELLQLKGGHYNPPAYQEEIRTNSDFCKFDDVLRMVLDCTNEQVVAIRELLEKMHASGQIDFGIFETEQALMTCLLFDLESSQHLHFIDGDEGGFWSAAKGYKVQLSSHDPVQVKTKVKVNPLP
ncbi:DUF3095 domain-containing protein [Granulosicoccus antarcticus]|uniref:Uncharacterized protein n=1 Tax=Granulosicoccus antarcticus IMCC3135 TaxID=1192854 RepID=A0A2Z2NM06_9GAMM|nr:DUF3095 domain-containing protein [Granulosicoccus antarcticus]ASJ70808.1 hypothetical protein IMCC3135_03475 [Granulosicoccus antarcticus IMCC3135]